MLIKSNVVEALRSLVNARQRTILALIGIIIGIGSVIGMVSIGFVVQQEALRQFLEMGVDIITVRKEFSEEKTGGLRLADVLQLPELGSIAEVAPFIASSTQVGPEKQQAFVEMAGVTESFLRLNKVRLKDGRLLSDLDAHRYFCILGEEAAATLQKLKPGPLLGQQFVLQNRLYTVIGLLERVPEGGLRPVSINRAALVPITTAERAFEGGEISSFMARVRGNPGTARIKRELDDFFAKRTRGLQLRVATAEELRERMEKQLQLYSMLLGAIGSIALVVGGIGVMNVMLISVSERRKEIGLRRALGAQRRDIQTQFLVESVALCLVGGVFGILLGVGASYGFAHYSGWKFLVAYHAVVLGFGVAAVVGIFFGYYPARSAARLDPIEALRS